MHKNCGIVSATSIHTKVSSSGHLGEVLILQMRSDRTLQKQSLVLLSQSLVIPGI